MSLWRRDQVAESSSAGSTLSAVETVMVALVGCFRSAGQEGLLPEVVHGGALGRTSEEIRSAVARGQVVLFCGAGVSIDPPATLPDWKAFRDETIKAVASAEGSLASHLPSLLKKGLLGGVGQALAPELVASQVRAVVPDYFRSLSALDHGHPNRNHALIAQLAHKGFVSLVVTTNFDQLIEQALTQAGTEPRVYRSDDDFAAFNMDLYRAGAVGVVKLHGCLSDPDTIVATVEQEAVGLSPQKAAVLRELLRDFTMLFWGYSGEDLKLDLDYLQMVGSEPFSRGFFWNLHATATWQEEPNEYVEKLAELYDRRGVICHENMLQALGPLVRQDMQASWLEPPNEDAGALRARRTHELTRALDDWARRSVRPDQALGIFGRLLERADDLPAALDCYQRLSDLGRQEQKAPLEALGYAGGGDLLSRMGEYDRAEEVLRLADDRARTAGALDLDLVVARTTARLHLMRGYILPAAMPLGFGRLASRWATPAVKAATLGLELDAADYLLAQGLVDLAVNNFQAAERRARDEGRLETVADALQRRSRAHERRGEGSEAVRCVREARDIVFGLGMANDVRLLEFRAGQLEAAIRGEDVPTPSSELLEAADQALNQRLSSELILDAIEAGNSDPKQALALASRVASYVEAGGSHLAVRLAVLRSRVLETTGNAGDAIETISGILPQLVRVGNEPYAVELFLRLARLQSDTRRPEQEVLHNLESASRINRRSMPLTTLFASIEDALADLRGKLGEGRYPADWQSFTEQWSAHLDDLPEVLDILAGWAGVSDEEDKGEAFAALLGSAGRFIWCLWNTGVLCRQLRLNGQAETALRLARGCLPVTKSLGDLQLTAVLHNECGLDLLRLGRNEEAFGEFEQAITITDASGDKVELIDDLFNAASACEFMGRADNALELYQRAESEVTARQDLAAALNVSLRSGEVLKAAGRDQDALSHFETAEYRARILSDEKQLQQALLRLGKVYWNLGEFEQSIKYRLDVMSELERQNANAGAASFAFLVANTYDEKLGRPRDALPFYRRALSLSDAATTGQDQYDLKGRLANCEQRVRALGGEPAFYELLINTTGSEDAAERLASRMALSVDYNLWRFELRSFAAWYERVFGMLPDRASGSTQPAWPLVALNGLCEMGKAAYELHDHEQAMAIYGVADGIAAALDMPGAREMVSHAIAAAERGRDATLTHDAT